MKIIAFCMALILLLSVGAWAATDKVLYAFCSQTNCSDGAYPYAGVISDKENNLYGTTQQGGSANFAAPRPAEGVRTVARRANGDDASDWIITGAKKWASSATGWDGRGADLMTVVCRTDPNAPPERRGGAVPIIEYQAVGYALADAKTAIEAVRTLSWRAAHAVKGNRRLAITSCLCHRHVHRLVETPPTVRQTSQTNKELHAVKREIQEKAE